jgi:hypothetical protein
MRMQAISFSQRVTQFLHKSIQYRAQERGIML